MADQDAKASQCTAIKTTGNRCTRPAIPGGSVCRYHGGAAPQVKAAAAPRLRAMVDPAWGALEYDEGQAQGPQGRSNGGKEVLDRAKPEGEGDGLEARSGLVVEYVRQKTERARPSDI